MKIGIDAHSLASSQKTGVEIALENLISNLSLIDNKNEYILYTNQKINLAEIVQGGHFRQRSLSFPFAWTQLRLPAEFLIKKNRPDIFLFAGHSIPLYCPVKSVSIIYDLAFIDFPQYFNFKDRLRLTFLTKRTAKKADHLIAISENTKKDLVRYYHLNPAKITVIYLGYNQNIFQPASHQAVEKVRKKYKLKKPYILYLGTLQKRKNIPRLILAFGLLKKRYRIPHQLVICGKKGWLYSDIFETVQKANLESEVIFTDYAPLQDLASLLTGAAVFVLPSLYEGFGLPLVEAAACGVPIVCSNISSLPEIVGETAILINPYKEEEIAGGIYKVISNPNLREALIKAGLARVKKFTWRKTAEKTLGVLKKVAQNE